jgi:hypothetical protein
MSITLANAISGMGQPQDFCKSVTATCIAGKPMSLLTLAGLPRASTVGSVAGNLPKSWAITGNTIANPTVVTCTGHPWANNDTISIYGSNSTPSIDGIWQISNKATNSFTVPVDVSGDGTTGTAAGYTSNMGAGITGVTLTGALTGLGSLVGQLRYPGDGNGGWTYTRQYTGRLQAASSTQTGYLVVYDRIWHNSGIDPVMATAQTFTNAAPVLTGRDADGSGIGVGVFAALEVYVALGASAFTPTITYTNSSGVDGQTATPIQGQILASSPAGTFIPFALAAGDVGVKKVTGIELGGTTGNTTGNMSVVLYRPKCKLEINGNGRRNSNAIDFLTAGSCVWSANEGCPCLLFVPTTTTATNIMGHYIFSNMTP